MNNSTEFPAKGYAVHSSGQKLSPFNFSRRALSPRDVLIDVKFCGICHSDIHMARGEWGGSRFPMVPGHEITGVVSAIGMGVTRFKIGDKVGVGCFVDSCRDCSNCREGFEQYCMQGMTQTYNSFERDGKAPTYGGYSNRMVVDENYVLKVAGNLDMVAPLLCAGITLYSPLKHWKTGPGKKVAIVGMGGLGHIGVKIAAAMGAEVTVLSHSLKKREDALRMGARELYSTADSLTFEKLSGKFDLIINTVSAQLDWNNYLELLKRDGTLVVVGIPAEAVPVHAFSVIGQRRSLAGSLIGGISETQEMLDFCNEKSIYPEIETIPITKVNDAFERVLKSDVRYRFVIEMGSL